MSTHPSGKPSIGEQVTRLMRERGVTQRQLAERLGVSQPAVARLLSESYDGHSVKSLRRIAEALDVSLNISFISTPESEPYYLEKALR